MTLKEFDAKRPEIYKALFDAIMSTALKHPAGFYQWVFGAPEEK